MNDDQIRWNSTNLSTLVLAGVTALAMLAPFGREASQPAVFAFFRALLIGVTVLCFWALRRRPSPDFPKGVYVLGAGILTLLAISVWASPGKNSTGWTLWYEHLLFALFFLGFARFSATQSSRWRRVVLSGLIAVGFGHLLLRSAFEGTDLGLFANGNYFAAYLLVPMGAAVSAAVFLDRLKWRLLGAAGAVAFFLGIISSVSRGATLAAFAIIVLALILHKGRRAAASLILVGAIAVLGISVWSPDLIGKFVDRGEIDPYNYQRVEIWASTADMIGAAPVLGVGPTRYEHVARRYRFPVEDTIGRFMKRASIAHSEYLHYAAEAGLPAAMMILGLIAYYMWLLSERHRSGKDPVFIETAGLLAAFGLGLHALVDNVFQVSAVTIVLILVALASSPLKSSGRIPFPVSPAGRTIAVLVTIAIYLGSSLVPALAYQLNEIGRQRTADGLAEEAIGAHRMAVAVRPNDAILLTDLGLAYKDLYLATGKVETLDVGEAYLIRAAEVNPEFLQPRQEYANTLVLRLSEDSDSNRYIHRSLAIAYLNVLELDPFLPFVRHNLAEALYKSGKHREAYDQVKHALALEPNFVSGYLKLADWYAVDGDPDESQRLRTEAASVVRRYAEEELLTEYESSLLGRPRSDP